MITWALWVGWIGVLPLPYRIVKIIVAMWIAILYVGFTSYWGMLHNIESFVSFVLSIASVLLLRTLVYNRRL